LKSAINNQPKSLKGSDISTATAPDLPGSLAVSAFRGAPENGTVVQAPFSFAPGAFNNAFTSANWAGHAFLPDAGSKVSFARKYTPASNGTAR
jgi:hypothetical protein